MAAEPSTSMENRAEIEKDYDSAATGRKVKFVAAPMVRYSKLPFRKLVRHYEVDVAYTPMIIASSFVQSPKCRNVEFTTDDDDRPLIVQFAAHNAEHFASATELVAPYADGVDLNCGCPQRWAIAEQLGSFLLSKPELIADMISQTHNRLSGHSVISSSGDSTFPVSIKIRLDEDLTRTVELCRRAVHAGVSQITVHGRTPKQRTEPVDLDAIRLIRRSVPLSVPIVANGDVITRTQALDVAQRTGVQGVMSARGLLSNPAMFAGFAQTPLQCINDWIEMSLNVGLPFSLWHHHLQFMLERHLNKAQRRVFNRFNGAAAVLDFLEQNYSQLSQVGDVIGGG